MKRIFLGIIALICLLSCDCAFAKKASTDMQSLKFNGNNYSLYYSTKSKEVGSYINEYYKKNQGYVNWTDLISLQHYPTEFYPIEQAKAFKTYLENKGISSELLINDETDNAILDFTIIDNKRLPIIMEYNVFKYGKSDICGTVAIQYAKRYRVFNSLEIPKYKKLIRKKRLATIKQVNNLDFPVLVQSEIDKGAIVKTQPEQNKIVENIADSSIEKEFVVKEEKQDTEQTSQKNINNIQDDGKNISEENALNKEAITEPKKEIADTTTKTLPVAVVKEETKNITETIERDTIPAVAVITEENIDYKKLYEELKAKVEAENKLKEEKEVKVSNKKDLQKEKQPQKVEKIKPEKTQKVKTEKKTQIDTPEKAEKVEKIKHQKTEQNPQKEVKKQNNKKTNKKVINYENINYEELNLNEMIIEYR